VYLSLVSETEQEIFRLLNAARAAAQIPTLHYDPLLYTCAAIRAKEAIELWSHTRPSGGDYWTVLEEKGISYVAVNENLCRKFTSVGEVVETILATDAYKNVVLDGKYTDSAVAVCQNAEGELYLCQIFMAPLTYS